MHIPLDAARTRFLRGAGLFAGLLAVAFAVRHLAPGHRAPVGQETPLTEAIPGIEAMTVIARPDHPSNRLHKRGQLEITGLDPMSLNATPEFKSLLRDLRATRSFGSQPPPHSADYAFNVLRCYGMDIETPDDDPVQYDYDSVTGRLGRQSLGGRDVEWCEVTPTFRKDFQRFVTTAKQWQEARAHELQQLRLRLSEQPFPYPGLGPDPHGRWRSRLNAPPPPPMPPHPPPAPSGAGGAAPP